MTTNKQERLLLYFGKRDQDLWDAIQSVAKGDRNHEIKIALRKHFLEEGNSRLTSSSLAKKEDFREEPPEDPTKDLNIGINNGLIK